MQLLNLTLGQYQELLFTRESTSVSATRTDRDAGVHIYFLFLLFLQRWKKKQPKKWSAFSFSVRGEKRGLKTIICATHPCPGSTRSPPHYLFSGTLKEESELTGRMGEGGGRRKEGETLRDGIKSITEEEEEEDDDAVAAAVVAQLSEGQAAGVAV